MRVVLDTNILVSALIAPAGNPAVKTRSLAPVPAITLCPLAAGKRGTGLGMTMMGVSP